MILIVICFNQNLYLLIFTLLTCHSFNSAVTSNLPLLQNSIIIDTIMVINADIIMQMYFIQDCTHQDMQN